MMVTAMMVTENAILVVTIQVFPTFLNQKRIIFFSLILSPSKPSLKAAHFHACCQMH